MAESTGKAVEPLSPGCRVPKVQGGGERDLAWIIFFVDDAILVEVQWRKDGARWQGVDGIPWGCAIPGDRGDRSRRGTPTTEQDDDGVVDSTKILELG